MQCEGSTLQETLDAYERSIADHGYAVCGVTRTGDHGHAREWAYTIGLLDLVGHPELIVAGPRTETAASLAEAVADALLSGTVVSPGRAIQVGRGQSVRVGAVHPVQYELETFSMWHAMTAHG